MRAIPGLGFRGFFLKWMARLPSGFLELVSLLVFYTLFRAALYYVGEIIGFWLFSFSRALLDQFHSDHEVLVQGVSIFASVWLTLLLFRKVQPQARPLSIASLLEKKNAGLQGGRLATVFMDGLLKVLLLASFFLALTTLLGATQFEIAVFLDFRGFITILPSLAGQFLSFVLWAISIELLRRYLHRILLFETNTPWLASVMLILFETHLLFQVFSRPGLDSGESLILVLCCMVLASGNLLWYRLGLGLPSKQHVRISMLRFGMSFGFWSAMIFIYGWSMGSFRATSFVNLLPNNGASEFWKFFGANRPAFLALVVWAYAFSANMVLFRLVRSVFHLFHLPRPAQPTVGPLVRPLFDAEELEFQQS